MHCFLIDPEARTVTDVTVDITNIHQIHKLIGDHYFDMAHTVVPNADGHATEVTLFVDDEGALKTHNHSFSIGRAQHQRHLAGLCLVAGGTSEDGSTLAPLLDRDEVEAVIEWHGLDKPVDTTVTVYTW